MTTLSKDEILRLAREAGATPYTNRHYPENPHNTFGLEQLEKFATLCRADLVAAHEACKSANSMILDSLAAEEKKCADLVAENERLEWALKDASVAAIAEALEVDALRAELSALRAGSGEAVGEVRNSEAYFYNGIYTDKTDVPNGTKLYTHPQPSAVPVVEQDKADAERYRWLRKYLTSKDMPILVGRGARPEQDETDYVDEATDKAMKRGEA